MFVRSLGSGRPLVALHGFGVDHRIMLPLEQAVRDAPWRRVYLDLPWAEGATVSTAASARDVAKEVLADIREHLGAEPFAIVGQSFGGMIARYIAHELRSQVLGVATLAGVVEAKHDARKVPDRSVLVVDQSVLDEAGDSRDEFTADHVVQTADTFAAFTEYVLPGSRGSNQAVMDRIAAEYALPVEPEVQHPQPFMAPSLHVFGRQDAVVGYEDGWALRDHYPRGTFAVLDTAGHSVHLERPDLTAALFRDWLDRMDATGR
ncbi:alpha/beta fold hydrolase [Cryobacterium sp. PAMC25264]|uniref:alpha/beta fold hydrolase n=1 Tax=Cryobacterium sp. PAMC25264 TaxID=2861288 RepID=UPI001C625474|nr:alpha/beta hydrolase [Cryobacterium sp. PAMC25264]QYF73976.1 alpha/beta hydrolase [Cryobacterium sp. PAMC25264]